MKGKSIIEKVKAVKVVAKKAKGMKPLIKAEWVKALKSGKYKKATGTLCRLKKDGTPKGYCCLGVLTDLYVKAHKKTEWQVSGGRLSFEGESALLPIKVSKWAGLKGDSDALVLYKGVPVHLANVNDTTKQTFPQIAELIKASL